MKRERIANEGSAVSAQRINDKAAARMREDESIHALQEVPSPQDELFVYNQARDHLAGAIQPQPTIDWSAVSRGRLA